MNFIIKTCIHKFQQTRNIVNICQYLHNNVTKGLFVFVRQKIWESEIVQILADSISAPFQNHMHMYAI